MYITNHITLSSRGKPQNLELWPSKEGSMIVVGEQCHFKLILNHFVCEFLIKSVII